jgi:recombinational DNA repair ATPase RecF
MKFLVGGLKNRYFMYATKFGQKTYLEFFGLENFKVFNEKQIFDLKAITLLIGANSSGKSSLRKKVCF